jgi:hypothetical protein
MAHRVRGCCLVACGRPRRRRRPWTDPCGGGGRDGRRAAQGTWPRGGLPRPPRAGTQMDAGRLSRRPWDMGRRPRGPASVVLDAGLLGLAPARLEAHAGAALERESGGRRRRLWSAGGGRRRWNGDQGGSEERWRWVIKRETRVGLSFSFILFDMLTRRDYRFPFLVVGFLRECLIQWRRRTDGRLILCRQTAIRGDDGTMFLLAGGSSLNICPKILLH